MAEDLYSQMREEEEDYNELASQQLRAPRKGPAIPTKEVDRSKARENYEKDFKPVFERIRRVQAGLPPTKNPIYNLFLKATGQDKLPAPEVVDPNVGIAVVTGKTAEEVRQEIIADPAANASLASVSPKVQPVAATRKTVQDLRGNR